MAHPDYKSDSFKQDGKTIFRQWRIDYVGDDGAVVTLDICVRGADTVGGIAQLGGYCFETRSFRHFHPARIRAILNLKTNRRMKSFAGRYGVG